MTSQRHTALCRALWPSGFGQRWGQRIVFCRHTDGQWGSCSAGQHVPAATLTTAALMFLALNNWTSRSQRPNTCLNPQPTLSFTLMIKTETSVHFQQTRRHLQMDPRLFTQGHSHNQYLLVHPLMLCWPHFGRAALPRCQISDATAGGPAWWSDPTTLYRPSSRPFIFRRSI